MTETNGSNTVPLVSDQLLEAYADGQLDSQTERRLEALVSNDPAMRRKVLQIMALRENLRQAVTERAGSPTQSETYDLARKVLARHRKSRHISLRKVSVGIAATFLLLGVAGVVWSSIQTAPGPIQTAGIESLLPGTGARQKASSETDAPQEQSAQAVKTTVKSVPEDKGTDAMPEFVPIFSESGFSLVETRLIEGQGRGAVHLLYEAEDGRRVSLYYSAVDEGRKQQVTVRQEGPLAILFWYADNRAFSMIGEVERAELLKLARTVTKGLSLNQEDAAPDGADQQEDNQPETQNDGKADSSPASEEPSDSSPKEGDDESDAV